MWASSRPQAHFDDARLNVMFTLVVLWGARLTFNFARKGGYAPGGEDYRWAVLRGRMPRWQFQLFNLVFITHLPERAAPADLPAGLHRLRAPGLVRRDRTSSPPSSSSRSSSARRWLTSSSGTSTAGSAPRSRPAGSRDPRFLQTGLFRFSRHPNFFFEQAQWWVVFVFGASAAGSLWQPTVIGAVLLTLLFVGSTRFTESLSKAKYPEYADYQASTSAVVPWFPKREPVERPA